MTALFVIATSLALVGLLLFLHGVIGRRIDDHPHCRKCRFDLFGRWPDIKNCPECGRELSARWAVRSGDRKRNRWTIALGFLLLVIFGSFATLRATGKITQSQIYRVSPVWFLCMELRSSDFGRSEGALTEFDSRDAANKLSKEDFQSIVPIILELQADRDRPWSVTGGDLIESGWIKKNVTNEQLQQYVDQGLVVKFTARKKARATRSMPIRRDFTEIRFGSATYMVQSMHPPRIIGVERQAGRTGLQIYTILTGDTDRGGELSTVHHYLDVGSHEIEYEFNYTIGVAGNNIPSHKQFNLPLEIVPVDAPVIDPIRDPAVAERIRQAIHIKEVQIKRVQTRDMSYVRWQLESQITIENLPVSVSYEVVFRSGNLEIDAMSNFRRVPGVGKLEDAYVVRSWTIDEPPLETGTTTIDIILRAHPSIAEGHPAIESVWVEDLIFENVPVVWK